MASVSLIVNGRSVTADVDPRTLLVDFLRDNLRLTGTHVGCDTSQCGACVVHVDGSAIKSCTALAVQLDGSSVTTIEGLAQNGALHPMQEAFRENHGLQCGFCTPGMIMTAVDLVNRKGNALDEATIRQELDDRLFDRTIQPGVDVWHDADVLRTYGRPFEITRVSSFDGVIWTWRYKTLNSPRMLYIYVDPAGVVRRYHTGDDLMLELLAPL